MSSSSSIRRKTFTVKVKHPIVVDFTGCGCRRPKLSSLFSSFSKPKLPKPKPSPNTTGNLTHPISPSSTSAYNDDTSPMFSSESSRVGKDVVVEKRNRKKSRAAKRVARESVAVVKESTEPYVDFRESMVQMIVEKELYGWDDLNDLLHHFLALNSPCHHPLIIRAFADIWDGVFSPQR